MAGIQNIKCPCCGAPLVFNPDTQKMHCESCETDFDVETMTQLSEADESAGAGSKYDWNNYEPRDYTPQEAENLASYTCPSCGAVISGDETLGSTVCPYCGNATIVKGAFQGSLMPDFVIPFRYDKKAAMEEYEKACKGAPFLPNAFKSKRKIEEMAGIYIPFWTFDCDCEASVTYNAERMTSWSDSNYIYTKTDHYRIFRDGELDFERVPVDGSRKAEDDYMEAIEPYDYNEAVQFNTAYLSGYLADKYDVSADECIQRANQRVKKSIEERFASTVNGFMNVRAADSSIRFSDGKVRYALMPVWMLNIKYDGQNYKYAINGQTGKVAGVFPISKSKRNAFFFKVFGVAAVVCTAISWFAFA